MQGWTETHTPILGDEITEEVIPETDAQGVVKGHYHISRDKGYEHVVYVPIFNYEQIDEMKLFQFLVLLLHAEEMNYIQLAIICMWKTALISTMQAIVLINTDGRIAEEPSITER